MYIGLLTIIYIAFIGLGLPDSMFGTAWPAIYQQWELPVYLGSFVTSITYFGTMLSSLLTTKVIKRFGTGRTAAFSTAFTALAMMGFAYSTEYWMLCMCAIPLGLGAGAIDTALNNYVASNYSVRHMNYLHCFYGIGIVVSPFVLSKVMHGTDGWSEGYLIVCGIQATIAILLFSTLPLWKIEKSTISDDEIETIPLRKLTKMKNVRLMWGLFATSYTIEAACGCYGSSFLVNQKMLSVETAALVILCYFAGIAIGRFISGIIAEEIGTWKVIIYCEFILGIGILTIILADTIILTAIGLLFIGLGNGPLFPNFSYLAPMIFGKRKSAAVIGSFMAVTSLTGITAPILCGILGMEFFPCFLLSFFVGMAIVTVTANKTFFIKAANT